MCSHKSPVPLLEYQAEHAFSGVPEKFLRKLYGHMGKPAPDIQAGEDYECQLALGLMQDLLHELNPEQTKQMLRARATVQAEDSNFLEVLDSFASSEVLDDVAGRAEKQFCKTLVNDARGGSSRREELFAKIDKTVSRVAATGGKKVSKAAAKAKAKASRSHAAKGLSDKRWWNSVRGDASFVELHGPPVGRIVKDDDNGRFFVVYPGEHRKSVSWTQRGMNSASIAALQWWWTYHTRATGEVPPQFVSDLFAST